MTFQVVGSLVSDRYVIESGIGLLKMGSYLLRTKSLVVGFSWLYIWEQISVTFESNCNNCYTRKGILKCFLQNDHHFYIFLHRSIYEARIKRPLRPTMFNAHVNGFTHDKSNTKAFAMELRLFCTRASISWYFSSLFVMGHLARYVKLRVAHAPGRPGTISGSLTARGGGGGGGGGGGAFRIANRGEGGGGGVPGIPGACATHNFTYLARAP